MKIIIAGCGRLGALLAGKLSAEGHAVVVIDRDPCAFEALGENFKGERIRGIVFDRAVLERAGAAHSDAFIAVAGGDNANVVAAMIARDIYRIPRTVARIVDPRRAEIYRRLGLVTVSSDSWASNEITALVLHKQLVRDVSLGDGEVQLVKVSLPPRLAGRSVAHLTMPGEVTVVAIVRGGKSFIPAGAAAFHDGDIVELAVLTSAMARLKSMIAP